MDEYQRKYNKKQNVERSNTSEVEDVLSHLPSLDSILKAVDSVPNLPKPTRIPRPNEEECTILRREKGDGGIVRLGPKVACEYHRIKVYYREYSECELTGDGCPFSTLPNRRVAEST